MAKRTAVIDIGSNSARLVIYEKTSRYGFHLICEQKSKVRIGEGAYEKDGYLQPVGIKRAFLALKSFLHTIDAYQTHKRLCVATSALRDAPNGKLFTQWIKQELGLAIKIIDGKKEALYGAIAANNLLPIDDGITVDIGGGSSDLALIQNGTIVESFSLNIGTVRIKELFYDKAKGSKDAHTKALAYIEKEIQKLPPHFKSKLAIGIGGTARTLAKGIMKRSEYPLDKLHGFTYNLKEHQSYLDAIPLSSAKGLKKFHLKKNRFDTIREGTLIFTAILKHLGAKSVISSSVGVREGLFLEQLLRHERYRFPKEINPSVISLLDRFQPHTKIDKKARAKHKMANSLYSILPSHMQDHQDYKEALKTALQLSGIGKRLTIYKAHQHGFYLAMQELNYSFRHEEIVLTALLLRMHGKELLNKELYEKYQTLLPPKQDLKWLSFIYSLSVFLHEASNSADIRFKFENQTLTICSDKPLYLAKEKIKSLQKPIPFAIIIQDESRIPHHRLLGI